MRLLLAAALVSACLWHDGNAAKAETAAIAGTLSKEFGKYPYGGGYVWRTGLLGSYHHPRKVLEDACTATGGSLKQTLRLEQGAEAFLSFRNQVITINPADVWQWSGSVFNAYSRENEVSQTSFVVSQPLPYWAPAAAFGLFGCYIAGSSRPDWFVAITVHHPKLLVIREITPEMLAESESRRYAKELAERERTQRQWREEDERRLRALIEQGKEKERLTPWRQALKVGDRTNCGMVIETRGPILKVQLPPGYRSPSGDGEFWVRRDDVTDAEPINGCRFGQ